MKIATWNIGEDETKENGKLDISSYEYIANTVLKKDVDILCLQEAIVKSDYLMPIADYIKEHTDLKYNVQFELSDSHINIGCRMGVVICSKHEITDYELFMLDNPNIVYEVNENVTYYSHEKGFIISDIMGCKIITGHCLPFHVFKKDPLEYIEIFNKADEKFTGEISANSKFVLCGDFNYHDPDQLFPNTMEKGKDLINEPTRDEKQLDHVIVSNEMSVSSAQVIENIFDHKLCLAEIN